MAIDHGAPPVRLSPVQFSRLAKRGVILGLSLPQVIVLAVGLITFVAAIYAGGALVVASSSPIWLTAAIVAFVPVGGRKVIEWLPVAGRWVWRATGGQLVFRHHVVKPRPAGTLALPGDAAALREWEDPETGAAMIHDPHAQTLTAVIGVTHPAFVLLDPGEQERRVSGWGRVLATACRSGRIARVQISERTLPDSGSGLAEWWTRYGKDDNTWPAVNYRELIGRAGPATERHATTISLALDMKACARQIRAAGGGMKGTAAVLRQEMATFASALRAAEITPTGWLSPGEVAVILRSAYDPAAGQALERHGEIGRSLATAGPVGLNETWERLRSDSAYHAVLWVSEWPRSSVYPDFLRPLLLTSGIQRTFTMIYTPVRADVAARDIRKKKVGLMSDATQRARMGQIEDAERAAEFQDVLQQESDLTAGHGVLRYTGLIAVSARTEDALEESVAAIEQTAVQASCETRRLVGQQAHAFAVAALPLCLGV
ncbi:hypothetical protein GCM10025873_08850 [Demequina sediminis]|uniref:SCO6880 family protein n=1 Tax=Demequina sediminis TaxID=1930058 RepID=UPI002574834F|nr:SCO6880 family protein [Demequina sediminis]BDZ61094.1 hypothetical protein GCM10025873_08850 [Demequina sediminis]